MGKSDAGIAEIFVDGDHGYLTFIAAKRIADRSGLQQPAEMQPAADNQCDRHSQSGKRQRLSLPRLYRHLGRNNAVGQFEQEDTGVLYKQLDVPQ